MNIAIIGFGGVGKALIRLIRDKGEFLLNKYNLEICIKYIIKSDGGIYNPLGINLDEIIEIIDEKKEFKDNKLWNDNINIDYIINNNDVDTVIELTSTNIVNGEPGLTHIKKH